MQDIADRTKAQPAVLETRAPARLDRLPWGRFHTLVVISLGVTWVLDGLEVTLAGSVAGALKASPVLRLTDSEVGLASSFYLAGAVSGSLVFGWLADRLGRRLLFFVTLWLYLLSAAATAFSWDLASFCAFRFLTGAGIGGEYSAVNSTIQEMIPARYRGLRISPSTVRSGSAAHLARRARSCSSIQRSSIQSLAGVSLS